MVAQAHALGVRGFDTAAALKVMDSSSSNPGRTIRSEVESWNTLHYYPENAAITIEYAAADFAISQFAAATGDTAMANKYKPRGQYWKNSFNPGNGYMQGRNRDGTWLQPWSPTTGDGYVEGNGSVYSLAVPWNVKSLVGKMGGESKVIPRLDTFFSNLQGGSDKPYLDIGNEPSFSQPWIYNSVRQPWKTQDVLNRIVTEKFHADQNGYPGDEDLGAMSSWLVWAYLGMYPAMPGTDVMVLGTPRFTSATLHLANGKTVAITAADVSAASHYTKALSVNGTATSHTWVRLADVMNGSLAFQTSTSPNTAWGSQDADVPPSFDG
jgi:predicted alpha-1,2-mannosidase